MKRLFGVVLFTILCNIVSAQTGIDSLKRLLASSKADTNRVLILSELVVRHLSSNNEVAMNYAQQGLALARILKFRRGEADCLRRSGIVLFQQGRYPEALDIFQQALSISQNINDGFGIGAGLGHVGNIYNVQGQFTIARSFYSSQLKISEARRDTFEQATALRHLGRSYLQEGYTDSSYVVYNRAYKLIHNKTDARLAALWNELGQLYATMGNGKQAMLFFRKSISIADIVNGYTNLSDAYFGIAALYSKEGNSDSSIYYAQQALTAGQKNNYAKGILAASQLLSEVYEPIDEHEAFKYHKMATAVKDTLFNTERAAQVQNLFFAEQQRQQTLEAARTQYKNQVRLYALLAALGVFLLLAIILWRNNRHRQSAYVLLQNQKGETDRQKQKAEQTLEELKATQSQLVQQEKMASLGELTAGIAHEIQNPLNFVNNFSEVNKELIEELKSELKAGNTEEAIAISNDIRDNEEKISHHGRRADAIVKGMLQHSRANSGENELTDINALADEYLRLSYQAMRSKNKDFQTSIETHFDPGITQVNIVPQDIGRVLLNLYNNAFYAASLPSDGGFKDPHYKHKPTVWVSTKKEGDKVVIRVRDNGPGIPSNILDKIFQPFFTTKPTGQGTGLGLSLSYDIIKAHGGELKAETKEGEGAEFIIWLPNN